MCYRERESEHKIEFLDWRLIKIATKIVNVELDGEDAILQVNWVHNYPIYKNVKEKKVWRNMWAWTLEKHDAQRYKRVFLILLPIDNLS